MISLTRRDRSQTGRRTALALALALVLAPAGSAEAGTPRYPDIRALPPTDLTLATVTVNDETHNILSLMPRTYNQGAGPLEIQRIPQSSGIAELRQRIYESPAGFRDQHIGSVSMSSTVADPLTVFTFPMPDLQRYEVWTQRDFNRATARHFARGTPLYVTEDVGQCVADVEQIDPTNAPVIPISLPGAPVYNCTAVDMGISPGWADVESPGDPHVVDFGTAPLPDGKYVLRAIVDPDNMLWESDGKADPAKESRVANQGVTNFEVLQGALTWQDPYGSG
jgi:hypothetical protein